MRRMILLCGTASFLTAFLGGALAFSLAIPKPVAAQSDRQLSGTWLQALAGPAAGQGGNALVTFSSDGTIILSTLGTLTLQPLDGVHRLSSPGHGNWVRIGGREFAATWWQYRWNAETTEFIGPLHVSCIIRLNETLDEYTCDQRVDYFDPAGGRDREPLASVPTIGHRMEIEMPS